jgi:hypothetical protein
LIEKLLKEFMLVGAETEHVGAAKFGELEDIGTVDALNVSLDVGCQYRFPDIEISGGTVF